MREKPHDFMGYCIPSFTNRKLGNSEDFDKALKFALCCIGKGYFTLKADQLDGIKCILMVKMYSCGSHRIILGSLSATRLCRLFSTTITVMVELAVVVASSLSSHSFSQLLSLMVDQVAEP